MNYLGMRIALRVWIVIRYAHLSYTFGTTVATLCHSLRSFVVRFGTTVAALSNHLVLIQAWESGQKKWLRRLDSNQGPSG